MMYTIMQEEQKARLNRVVSLTMQGKVDWKCVEYNPLSFMGQSIYDESPAYLSQIFLMEAYIGGLRYRLDILERITLPDGKGDVAITLSCDHADLFCKIDEVVSGDQDTYDDCAPEDIAIVFKDHPAMQLSSAIVPTIVDSDAVKRGLVWARFFNETGIPQRLLNHPLTKLAEKLFKEQRILDYHRIIFDTQYRGRFLCE